MIKKMTYLSLLFACIYVGSYFLLGPKLVELTHEERLPACFSRLHQVMEGRHMHPVEFYQTKANKVMLLGLGAIFLFYLICVIFIWFSINVFYLILSGLVCYILIELLLRLFVQPTPHASGTLFGRELPPFTVIPFELVPSEEERVGRYDEILDSADPAWKDVTISSGDLQGIKRQDDDLDYVLKENSRSRFGWYVTNNLGARADRDYPKEVPEGNYRILVFGESYGVGNALPLEQTWSSQLDEKSESLEVVNFSVGGYSMGQAYMRYQKLKNRIDYDMALVLFVVMADLYRSVNVMRYLPYGWKAYKPYGRHIIDENGDLKFIPSPYKTVQEMLEKNPGSVSPELRKHLVKYDSFYFPKFHEEHLNPILNFSIFYKLLSLKEYNDRRDALFDRMLEVESEAMQLNRKILDEMGREVAEDGGDLLVVLLPVYSNIDRFEKGRYFFRHWTAMSQYLGEGDYEVLDMMGAFRESTLEQRDVGVHGSHIGPKASQLIANEIWEVVKKEVATGSHLVSNTFVFSK